ncbi:MAG: UDP-glucuronic acid decarboxylase family protein [Candidatus Diapherotrites archaeon]
MRALVTGCAGFLGSNLCEYLIKEGYEIVGIDNLCTGKIENIKDFPKNKFKFIKADISKNFKVKGEIDEIYNLASPASPLHYQKLSIETMFANSFGVKNILEIARKKDALLLHTSTSEVYGNPLVHPQVESYYGNVNPVGPRACYDESKRFAEALIMNYHWRHGLKTRIARIFNTYGPKMSINDGRVIPNFIMQAMRNEPITVYGDGSQTRSFCYVSDMIEGLYELIHCDYNLPVNLGNPKETTIIELANKIIRLTNSSSKIVHKEMPKDDPERRRPNIELAKKLIGWEPKVSLEDGLKQTIAWFERFFAKKQKR